MPKTKKKSKIKAKQHKTTPRQELDISLNTFLIDLDCGFEVFEVVDPVLKKRDDDRNQRIKEFYEQLQKAGTDKEQKSEVFNQGLPRFFSDVRKLERGHKLFRSNTFIALVSRFDEFVGDVIRCIHKAHPDRLKSSEKSLSYDELIRLTDINQAVNCLIDKEVDKVLRDSHTEQIQHIEKKLNLKFRESLTCWSQFVELTERRNILVHCGGAISPQYLKVCKSNKVDLAVGNKEGNRLVVDQEYFDTAHSVLYEIGLKLGQTVLRNLFPAELKAIDSSFNNFGVELLSEERWKLAKMFFEFATSLPTNQIADDEMRKVFLINRAIALKFSGDKNGCKSVLDKEDWSSANSTFKLATHILRDEFPQAGKIMNSMNADEPIGEDGFRTWPLFRNFRQTEEFRKAYKTIYKKEFSQFDAARQIQEQVTKQISGGEVSTNPTKV